MCILVHSPWLPGYTDVVQTVLVILTMAGLFLDRPLIPQIHMGGPQENRVTPQSGSSHHLQYHLQLRQEKDLGDKVGVVGFRGNSQGGERRKCLVSEGYPAMQESVSGKKIISCNSSLPSTGPRSELDFLYKCRFPL